MSSIHDDRIDNPEYFGFLLNELGSAGATHEVIAQWFAPSIMIGDMSVLDFARELSVIFNRIGELMANDGEKIWPGLMPGPPRTVKWAVINMPITDPFSVKVPTKMRKGTIISCSLPNTDRTLFWSEESRTWFVAELMVYRNLTSPDSDHVGPGNLIELPEDETVDINDRCVPDMLDGSWPW